MNSISGKLTNVTSFSRCENNMSDNPPIMKNEGPIPWTSKGEHDGGIRMDEPGLKLHGVNNILTENWFRGRGA